ncbi:hypothetical protein DA803_01650 [[Mycoplasma] phocae]|uniref:Lipoprotein-associated type-17 domain-containing protein n=1 Tax=[Mycoplasma] phocae TaxID=142651 RepID=A0A2Z5ISL8_9BACT|nr:variable surface lipoprotein [[Mycoplasma] phocae]AXE60788.1 hypothetical protein DA803_01650 [[Mycoplasma] phocae]
MPTPGSIASVITLPLVAAACNNTNNDKKDDGNKKPDSDKKPDGEKTPDNNNKNDDKKNDDKKETEEQKLRKEITFKYIGTIDDKNNLNLDNIKLDKNNNFEIEKSNSEVKIKIEATLFPPTVRKYSIAKLTLKKDDKSYDFYVKFKLDEKDPNGTKTIKSEFDEAKSLPTPTPQPKPDVKDPKNFNDEELNNETIVKYKGKFENNFNFELDKHLEVKVPKGWTYKVITSKIGRKINDNEAHFTLILNNGERDVTIFRKFLSEKGQLKDKQNINGILKMKYIGDFKENSFNESEILFTKPSGWNYKIKEKKFEKNKVTFKFLFQNQQDKREISIVKIFELKELVRNNNQLKFKNPKAIEINKKLVVEYNGSIYKNKYDESKLKISLNDNDWKAKLFRVDFSDNNKVTFLINLIPNDVKENGPSVIVYRTFEVIISSSI